MIVICLPCSLLATHYSLLLSAIHPRSHLAHRFPDTREQRAAASPSPLTGPAGFPPPVMNKPYPGTGVVALINKQEGWIEINHEDIKDLMPAMQMEFNVKDKTLLDRAAVGDRVDFTIIETPQGEYLIDLKKK